jgi:hypothetical protein
VADPGLAALVTLLRFQGIGADPELIRHKFGHGKIGVPEMLRCAKDLGLKARFLPDELAAARDNTVARHCGLARRRLSVSWQSRRRQRRSSSRPCRRARP